MKGAQIIFWWTTGFGQGNNAMKGLTSEHADYYLKEPLKLHAPTMKQIWQMEFLLRQLVEFLDQVKYIVDEEEVYEQFLEQLANLDLETTRGEQLTSETVMKHAETLICQTKSFDDNSESGM